MSGVWELLECYEGVKYKAQDIHPATV